MPGLNVSLPIPNPRDFGPGQTGDSNIDRRWQDQVDLDSELRKYYEKKEFHDTQRRYEREDQVWKRGYDAQIEFANKSLAWQYKQARDAGLDPSVVHGAPGFRPIASFAGGPGGGPRMGAPPKMRDQNVTRAARSRGLNGIVQMTLNSKAEREKTSAETEMIKAQTAAAKQQLKEKDAIPLTHQLFQRPDGEFIWAPTKEYSAASFSRPISAFAENVEEIYDVSGKGLGSARRFKNNKNWVPRKRPNSPMGKGPVILY